MDEITRLAVDNNKRLRRALVAMRDGHKEQIEFLAAEGWVGAMPTSLTESIALAETVATLALTLPQSDYDVNLRAALNMLLQYGDHEVGCDALATEREAFQDGGRPCTCGWDTIYVKIKAEQLDGVNDPAEEEIVPDEPSTE